MTWVIANFFPQMSQRSRKYRSIFLLQIGTILAIQSCWFPSTHWLLFWTCISAVPTQNYHWLISCRASAFCCFSSPVFCLLDNLWKLIFRTIIDALFHFLNLPVPISLTLGFSVVANSNLYLNLLKMAVPCLCRIGYWLYTFFIVLSLLLCLLFCTFLMFLGMDQVLIQSHKLKATDRLNLYNILDSDQIRRSDPNRNHLGELRPLR